MIVVGIDLAAQPPNTAGCVIEQPTGHPARLALLTRELDDGELLELMTRPGVSRVAIDAPFGWPVAFLDAVNRYRESGCWPDPLGVQHHQSLMRLRATDRAVVEHAGISPLSVSTDRIAIVAMRCARLLSAYWAHTSQQPDRSGRGTAVEVYPAAALRRWGLSQHDHPQDPGSYRGSGPGPLRRRSRIVRSIIRAGTGWLELSAGDAKACVSNDHLLDALIAGLVAMATELGQVLPIPDPRVAAGEGWIALPSAPVPHLGGPLAHCEQTPHEIAEVERLIPPGGYLEIPMPDQFELGIQDRVGGPWSTWATDLRREWFVRNEDGSYVCAGHGGSPIYFRALSIDDHGVFEHVDSDGYGRVYRYQLRPEEPRE